MRKVIEYLRNPESEAAVVALIAENAEYYRSLDTEERIEDFGGSLYNQLVLECVMDNQYIALSKNEYRDIHEAYKLLVRALRDEGTNRPSEIRAVVRAHRRRLVSILERATGGDERFFVPCAEYSSEFQLGILRLDPADVLEPILDIGCGKDHALVTALSKRGAEAYGLDQYRNPGANILCGNWLEHEYPPESWGTILSHMAFTNHFRRAIVFGTGDRARYEAKYLEILASLKPGGRFVYAPAVPEMERTLPLGEYAVSYHSNLRDEENLDTVHVTRLVR